MLYHANINKNQPGMSKLLTDKIEGREEGGNKSQKSVPGKSPNTWALGGRNSGRRRGRFPKFVN